jgi:hypothetical protein
MIGAALARTAIEEPIPGREITVRLLKKAECPIYASADAIKRCPTVRAAEPDLRRRAGC